MKEQDYQYFLDKSKNEIMEEMGEEFNFYPLDVWTYTLGTTWFGRKKVLIVLFSEGRVVKVILKKVYGRIKTDQL